MYGVGGCMCDWTQRLVCDDDDGDDDDRDDDCDEDSGVLL